MKKLLVCILFALFGTQVFAQDFNKGLKAYNSGDYEEAFNEWKPLAEAGDARAQNKIALLLFMDRGIPQDLEESAKWNRLSAEQGYADSQFALGISYALGTMDFPQSNIMAYLWYRNCSFNGRNDCHYRLVELEKEMTQEEIKVAQAMARECMKSDYKKCGY